MATLPQGQEPSPFMQPQAHLLSLLSQAIFWNSLGIHPSHPRKHFILTMNFSSPPGQCVTSCVLTFEPKFGWRGRLPLRSDRIRKQQSPRITSTVRKATRSLKGRLGNCTVPLQLDGYWPQQVPKPSLHSC